MRVFEKVLVANHGEVAVRAFRAAYELGAGTVAVFPWEDRNSVHRLKADESYQIGEVGYPVRAHLSVDEIVRAARKSGADAVYPATGSCRSTRAWPTRAHGPGPLSSARRRRCWS
jgi:pyruvate carboxylase